MRIAFAINDLATERTDYTTTHLAMHAVRRGNDVWYVEVGAFALDPDNGPCALARRLDARASASRADLMQALRDAHLQTLQLCAIDVLFLRNDPAQDALGRPWAQLAGVNFGRLAEQVGVLVVNRPDGLYHAINKLYLQLFPREIRPRTFVTRDFASVCRFLEEVGGKAVVKPLGGSGGHNVFLIDLESRYNLRQIFDAVCREGYVIAQEFLPESSEGDTRVFLLEGEIIEVGGTVAAVRRLPQSGDLRSNLSAGGSARPPVMTQAIRDVVSLVRPQLQADGMFFVGLDLIGGRLVEANVFSPGALVSTERVTGIDFGGPVIEALERRLNQHRLSTEGIPARPESRPPT